MDKILYGGDYNPEQWLDSPDILTKDIEYMKKAKINAVSLGMFSWAVLEPEEGVFNFKWMENVIDNLYNNSIYVILATPSGARPKWLSDKYPEVLRVDENRNRNLFGGRHNHCYTSPVYREKVAIINRKLGEKFGSCPGVIMYHISNEYGGECHCPLCQKAFQKWLKNKYKDINELNKRWCTTFWSHTYNSFEQVESPSGRGELFVHALNLDWKRFVNDQTMDFLEHEINAVKSSGSIKPTTTNMMYDFVGLNYTKMSKIIDVISWDSYPVWHKLDKKNPLITAVYGQSDGEEIIFNRENLPINNTEIDKTLSPYKLQDILTARDNGMQHDFMRSLKHQPFLLMESCPSGTNWQGVSKLKKPGLLEAASLQAIAHGSDSVMYFQIRQSQGSSEKFHGAVIDHYGGDDTRVFKEVCKIGQGLESLKEIKGTNVRTDVAIIYDVENRWAMEDAQGPRNKGLYYHEAVLKSYCALRKKGINVDVISQEQDISNYKLVIAPMLYMFRAGFEEKIRDFVAEGGHLVMTYWSGIVDENDRCFLGAVPYGLQDVLGLRSTEIDGLYDGEFNRFLVSDELKEKACSPDSKEKKMSVYAKDSRQIEKSYLCEHLCDLVQVSTAQVLMVYGSDFYKGYPAFTKNKYKNGVSYYICADVEESFYDDWYDIITSEAQVKSVIEENIAADKKINIPDGIEVTSRYSDKNQYIFIQNYNNYPVEIDFSGIKGQVIYGELGRKIQPFATIIIKTY